MTDPKAVAEAEERHRPRPDFSARGASCHHCRTDWPCDAGLLIRALSEERQRTYPHMCRDDHPEIGHRLSDDDERCPVCRERDRADAFLGELTTEDVVYIKVRCPECKRHHLQPGVLSTLRCRWCERKELRERLEAAERDARILRRLEKRIRVFQPGLQALLSAWIAEARSKETP